MGPEATRDLHVVKYNTSATRSLIGAQFVGQSVVTKMVSGQTYSASVQFKNTGTVVWTKATGFKMGAINPLLNTNWGANVIPLADGETINPGTTKTFKFSFFAPSVPGAYNFQWQMRNFAGTFGQTSTNVVVQVNKVSDAARYLAQATSTSVHAGQKFWVQVNMANVGLSTWTQAAYTLRAVAGQPTWGVASAPLTSSVSPNIGTVFLFVATAPGTPGIYTMQWQMFGPAGFFGDKTPTKTITVVP
jgi:hypothetical protein